MIWHPLSLSVLALDALALAFATVAAVSYARVLFGWVPGSAAARQIALEADCDGARLATRTAIFFFLAASLLLVLGISLLLPALVPGAMCGTGVLQAMGGLGTRALILRAGALAILWIWRSLDGVHRAHPRSVDEPTIARWQLLALPVLGLAVLTTVRAFLNLDPHQPVSCCQVVYDAFRSREEATHTAGLSDGFWLLAASGTGILLAGLAAFAWRSLRRRTAAAPEIGAPSSRPPSVVPPAAVLLAAAAWLPAAATALVTVLSAYHYEVLHHHCPWCLFLPEHGAVGIVLYGALLLVGLEALAVFAVARFARSNPAVSDAARSRQRRALLRILGALLVFTVFTVGPALLWRWRTGVWMHGG